MDSGLERVAKAMCRADGFDPESDIRRLRSGKMLDIKIHGPAERWHFYSSKAVAALKEMRTPSVTAVNAGGAKCAGGALEAMEVWKAMVDAMLLGHETAG